MSRPPFVMSKYMTELDLQRDARAYYERRVLALEDALEQAAEFIAGYVDVVDGDYGQPEPNAAMRLADVIDEAINGPRHA